MEKEMLPRVLKMRCLFCTLVVICFVHLALVYIYFVWNGRWSQTTTYCSLRPISYSGADNSNHSTLSCGAPCYQYDNRTEFHVFLRILESYQTFHKSQRQRISNGQPVNSLTWYCITGCGGIGDRMKGMYAAFLLALAMNRTFFIYQSEEVQKTMYIEPNAIDWRPVSGCVKMYKDETLNRFGYASNWQRKLFGDSDSFHLDIDRLKHKEQVFVSWIRGIRTLIRDISRSSLGENLPLLEVLLSLSQKQDLHCLLSIVHKYLFNISRQVVRNAASSLAMLNLQPQKFVSVHIRTGFMNSWFGEITVDQSFYDGVRFARTQASWRGMIDCALRIADSTLGGHSLLLVSSDDQEPKDWAVATYGARIRVLSVHPVHVTNQLLTASGATDESFLQNWLELAAMAQSRAIVRIPSGFPDVASHMCSMSPESLYTYSIADKWCRDVAHSNNLIYI